MERTATWVSGFAASSPLDPPTRRSRGCYAGSVLARRSPIALALPHPGLVNPENSPCIHRPRSARGAPAPTISNPPAPAPARARRRIALGRLQHRRSGGAPKRTHRVVPCHRRHRRRADSALDRSRTVRRDDGVPDRLRRHVELEVERPALGERGLGTVIELRGQPRPLRADRRRRGEPHRQLRAC